MADTLTSNDQLIDHLAHGLDLPRDEIIRLINRAMTEPLDGWTE